MAFRIIRHIFLSALCTIAPPSWAEVIKFSCSVDGFQVTRDVEIDLENKHLKIGSQDYQITKVGLDWITAAQIASDPEGDDIGRTSSDSLGGTIYVQSRWSGEWISVSIARYEMGGVRAGIRPLGGTCTKLGQQF